ncbi:MAG: DUF86 domain-containing protein [Paludibacteraceae bacterium]|nr:DUF86 domain-containing protein [Paludibacteraceae bacterium]
MQSSIRQLEATLAEYSKEGIKAKPVVYYGIIKLIEIIGEAAYMLTKEFKEGHDATPWDAIIGMRHVLVHGYYQITENDVWLVVDHDLKQLAPQIDAYINEIDNTTLINNNY